MAICESPPGRRLFGEQQTTVPLSLVRVAAAGKAKVLGYKVVADVSFHISSWTE